MIYLIILILLLAFVYLYDYKDFSRYKWLCYILMYLIMGLTAGLKYRIGTDTFMYESHYEWAPKIENLAGYDFSKERYGILFMGFQSIFRSFTSDFLWMQLAHNMFVIGVFFWFFKSNTKHMFTALLLFYAFLYTFSMEVMREALAVSIFLLAWPLFLKGRWTWYYVLAFLAFGFHISSIIMFLLPIMYIPGIRQLFTFGRRQWIILPGVLIFAIGLYFLFYKYMALLAFTDQMAERVQTYSKNENFGGNTLNIVGSVSLFVKQALLPLLAMYCLNQRYNMPHGKGSFRQIKDNPNLLRLYKTEFMVIVGLMFVMLTIPIFIMQRYVHYFMPFSIIVISDWIFTYIIVGKKKMSLGFSYWIVMLAIPIYLESMNLMIPLNKAGTIKNYDIYYPYSSYLNPKVNPKREQAALILLRL